MAVITTEKLGATVGAEVARRRPRAAAARRRPARPGRLEALEANGALVFRDLHLDDATQVAFSRKLGEVEMFGEGEFPEIFRVTLDPAKNPAAQYLRGTFDWHIDGCTDDIPIMATMLSAHAVAETGGETEFASTYAAYDDLDDDEKERLESVRVVHTIEASQRLHNPNPSPEEVAMWRQAAGEGAPARVDAPLGPRVARARRHDRPRRRAWTPTRAARCSTTCSPGRPRPTGCTATSGRSATWSSGTTAACSTGRCPYDPTSPRDMHRTTFAGDEPIQ